MRPSNYQIELKALKEQISVMASQFARHWKEIDRWKNNPNFSANEFNNSLWNMRHNELTCAFLYSRMKEFEEKQKTLRLLYDEN